MKNAIYIGVGGTVRKVAPQDGRSFTLDELQGFVGGLVEIVPLPGGREIIVNEEGKMIGLVENQKATKVWKKLYPIEQYPDNNDKLVVGDVLIAGRNLEQILQIIIE